jgi:uncharacterized protein YcbK (DUF882 family)
VPPFSTRTMRPQDWAESIYFSPGEFRHPEQMGYEFILWLNEVRKHAGVPMRVTSSYRTPDHNARVGGAANSSHTDTPCDAVDIGMRVSAADPHWNHGRFRVMAAAVTLGCTRIGIYPNGSVHLDRTDDRRPGERLWVAVDNPARP